MSTHILIGDVGATGGKWIWRAGNTSRHFKTIGYHPLNHDRRVLQQLLEEVHAQCPVADQISYYGTGVINDEISLQISTAFNGIYPDSTITVASDLIAAIRATNTSVPSIVCILGTGSNSCLAEHGAVVQQIPSLGYPLGDEGSGWRIGLAIVRGFYYREMPESLAAMFSDQVPPSHVAFLHIVKNHISPNTYLGAFARFAADNAQHPWIHERVQGCLHEFVTHHILPYRMQLPVFAIGGIAHAFSDTLQDLIEQHELELRQVIRNPIDRLINHQ